MNAVTRIDPPDEITTFLGPLEPAEYEQRRRIRSARNSAIFKSTRTESPAARDLCWMVTECATAWLYRPAPIDELQAVAQFLRRLLTVADQAETIEGWLA